MGGVTTGRRGRILTSADYDGGRVIANGVATSRATPYRGADLWTWAFIASLPMFGQVFHYIIDVPALYYLSKIWPILMLPLVLVGMLRIRAPYRLLFLATLGYALVVAPGLSMVYFGNNLFDALATTVKAWPISYYFAFLAALCLLKITSQTLARTFLAFGLASWIILVLLWVTVPESTYVYDPEVSRLFLLDINRGARIYFPVFFGILFLLYITVRLSREKRIIDLILISLIIASMFLIFKQRVQIASTIFVISLILFNHSLISAKVITIWLGVLVVGCLVYLTIGPYNSAVVDSLGGSLTVRQQTLEASLSYLSESPLRWLFGVGAITRHSSTTLADVFDAEIFYLADIGWAGILFEYGIVGGLLIAGVHIVGLREVFRQPPQSRPMFDAALCYMVLYLIAITVIFPPMYSPGELSIILAAIVYLRARR